MRERVEVTIMGQPFTVVTDEDPEHVQAVATSVDDTIRQLAASGHPPFTAAVMTALNLASECQKLKEEQERVEDVVDRVARRLSEEQAQARAGGKEIHSSERTTSPGMVGNVVGG